MLHNNIYLIRYLILTLINFFGLVSITNNLSVSELLVFVLGIILNQLFLYIVVADLLEIHKNPTPIPTWVLAILKFLVLIFVFVLVLSSAPENAFFLVISYIFQLIILVLSTKRVVKKN